MRKISKELRGGLLLLASHLPEQTCLVGERVRGKQLLEENPLTRMPNGAPIVPTATYRRMVPKGRVNHGRRLLQAYESQGRAGVLAYCQPHLDPEHFGVFSAKLSELVPA